MDGFHSIEQMKKEEEEERRLSLERRKKRETEQTELVRVSLNRRGKTGFGLGISDTDGHCLVHRLVRNEYYHDSVPDDENPISPNRLRLGDRIIKVGDSIVVDYFAAVTEIKATADVLELTVLRDPSAQEPVAWLRDRIYNHSKPLYYTILTILCSVAAVAVSGIVYVMATMEGPPPPQTTRHEYQYPFGNHPKEERKLGMERGGDDPRMRQGMGRMPMRHGMMMGGGGRYTFGDELR